MKSLGGTRFFFLFFFSPHVVEYRVFAGVKLSFLVQGDFRVIS